MKIYSGPLNCQYLKDLIYNLQVSFSVPVSIVTMRGIQGCQKKSILIINLLLLVAAKVDCGRMYGIETSKIMNTSFYQCYRSDGYDRVIMGVIEINYPISNLSI